MFIRRLILIFVTFLLAAAVLLGQSFRLTVMQGDDLLEEAERRMVRERWTPTVRGRILDRNGEVLARDAPSFDVLVAYPIINGSWAYSAAAKQAYTDHREAWAEIDTTGRETLILAVKPMFDAKLERLWHDLAEAADVQVSEIEQRRMDIIGTVQAQSGAVWERQRQIREAELNRDRDADVYVPIGEVVDPLGIQVQSYAMLTGLREYEIGPVRRVAERYEGVEVSPGSIREYPYESIVVRNIDRSTFPTPLKPSGSEPAMAEVYVEGVGSHLLGAMRTVWREDVDRRPKYSESETGERVLDRGYYRSGDTVGMFGLERSLEDRLRGLRGIRLLHRDTGEEEVIEDQRGEDVVLSLDIQLQARIQALMHPDLGLAVSQEWHNAAHQRDEAVPLGTPLNGAAVVLDIQRGEILAMVSTPTYTHRQLRDDPMSVWGDEVNTPGVNRCVSKPYPPGSIVKPLILASAVTSGVYDMTPIACTGAFDPMHPKRNRCWIWKQYHVTHTDQFQGPLHPDEAIGVSCNVFFHTLAQIMGLKGIEACYHDFGVERPLDLGLELEHEGRLKPYQERETDLNDAVMMGIGQGPVTWTPLHAAHAYATLALGGRDITPQLIRAPRTTAPHDLKLDPAACAAALEGLRQSVSTIDDISPTVYGTGSVLSLETGREPIFNAPGVRVIGKTGTADAPAILVDPDGEDGPLSPVVARTGDHSWFVILVGPDDGELLYAVAVLMEYAGSGGRVSGPIANQIIRALQTEGYL